MSKHIFGNSSLVTKSVFLIFTIKDFRFIIKVLR
jgi:hypothetical protein